MIIDYKPNSRLRQPTQDVISSSGKLTWDAGLQGVIKVRPLVTKRRELVMLLAFRPAVPLALSPLLVFSSKQQRHQHAASKEEYD